MKKLFIYLMVIPLISVTALGAKLFRDEAHALQFSYDEEKWEIVANVKETPEMEGASTQHQTLVTVQRKQAEENYHPRFSVVVEDASSFLKESDPLRAYSQRANRFLTEQRFAIHQTGELNSPKLGVKAYETIADQRDFGLTFRQVVFLRGDKAYVLTAAHRTKTFLSGGSELAPFFNTFELTRK